MNSLSLDMTIHKETGNKIRWDVVVEDTRFSLYIPKACVPSPLPRQIRVLIAELNTSGAANGQFDSAQAEKVGAVVERVEDMTRTVRYRPVGDPSDWQIGEPYLPYGLLEDLSPSGTPQWLRVDVHWL